MPSIVSCMLNIDSDSFKKLFFYYIVNNKPFKNIFKQRTLSRNDMVTKKKAVKKKTLHKKTTAEDVVKAVELEDKKIEESTPKQKVKAIFSSREVMTEDTDLARELYNQSRYGAIQDRKVHLSYCETLYLLERNKISLFDGRNKEISTESFLKKALKFESNFWVRYQVFKDFRSRGYIIKTALKFGADFRVYDRGIKPGEDHAKWIVYPVKESEGLTWYEFSSKNRVAHSTKKRLLIGCVDEEGDCTYWEVKWTRP